MPRTIKSRLTYSGGKHRGPKASLRAESWMAFLAIVLLCLGFYLGGLRRPIWGVLADQERASQWGRRGDAGYDQGGGEEDRVSGDVASEWGWYRLTTVTMLVREDLTGSERHHLISWNSTAIVLNLLGSVVHFFPITFHRPVPILHHLRHCFTLFLLTTSK